MYNKLMSAEMFKSIAQSLFTSTPEKAHDCKCWLIFTSACSTLFQIYFQCLKITTATLNVKYLSHNLESNANTLVLLNLLFLSNWCFQAM